MLSKLLQNLVPKSSRVFIKTMLLVQKSRQFSSLHTNNRIVLHHHRLIESNVKTLTFVKLFSDDVQPVNGKGKKKRRRVVSSDEEEETVIAKKRLVSKSSVRTFIISNLMQTFAFPEHNFHFCFVTFVNLFATLFSIIAPSL